MTTIADRIRPMLRKIGLAWTDPSGEFDQTAEFERIVREIAREEIKAADDADKERRRKMLEDMRAGRPVDAFVNRGKNPHGNSEPEDSTT